MPNLPLCISEILANMLKKTVAHKTNNVNRISTDHYNSQMHCNKHYIVSRDG